MSEVFVNQCGLRWLPLQDGGGRVLASPDLETNTSGLLVLITGTNSVRAGVWGRNLCVTDSVEHGTAKPLVRWALGRGFAVVAFDPNDPAIKEDETREGAFHCVAAWQQVVARSPEACPIAIVAHSFGGACCIDCLFHTAPGVSSSKPA